MLRSLLIGLVAGQRAMSPLALLAGAARRDLLDTEAPGAALLRKPFVTSGAVALAAAEMAGDKMKSAPDRTVILGLIPRALTSSFAGAALAPKGQRATGAVIAGSVALASSFLGLALRRRAMARYGQTATGFVEDALVLGAGSIAAGLVRR